MKRNFNSKTRVPSLITSPPGEADRLKDLSRRSFLGKMGGAATMAMVAGTVNLEGLTHTKHFLPTALQTAAGSSSVRVRQDVATLTQRQIGSYRKGVREMMSRPESDPTSWLYQANIHGTYDTPVRALWNTCQHGSFFFVSWHRMYAYWFERIVRAASGDPDFVLPYWNWSNATTRALPDPFIDPPSRRNPLFTDQRAPGINDGAMLPFSAVQIWQAFGFDNFSSPTGSGQSFGGQELAAPQHLGGPHGQFESRPHDINHILIGGDLGLMSDPNLAARDPIFWLHHANVDRLWARWLNLQHGRADSTSAVWLDTPFQFFDENGNQVTQTARDVLDTAAQLNYTYDDDPGPLPLPPPVPPPPHPPGGSQSRLPQIQNLAASAQTPVMLSGTTLQTAVSAQAGASARMAEAAHSGTTSLLLHLDNLKFDRPPGVIYEIYVNLPDSESADPRGPHFVGTLALFGVKPHHGAGASAPINIELDMRGAVAALDARGEWTGGDLTVTFVPRGLEAQPGRAPLAVATIHTVQIGTIWISTE